MKFVTSLLLVATTTLQPIFASASEIHDPAMESLDSMTPQEFAAKLRSMPASERRDVLETYRTYLVNLDAALAQAERYSVNHEGRSVELTVAKTGLGFLAAGALIALPSISMTGSKLVIVSWFGQLGLRGAAGVAGVGALLLSGAALSSGTKIALNEYQIRQLRKSIAHIHRQVTEIERLSS